MPPCDTAVAMAGSNGYVEPMTFSDDYMQGDLPAKLDQHNSVIVFDWDDTLFPSTWLADRGLRPSMTCSVEIPNDVQERLDKLEESVVRLLRRAKEHARVMIITSAGTGWVELSAKCFMPKLAHLLDNDVKIISARGSFEKLYPNDILKWKTQAFMTYAYFSHSEYSGDFPTNIISVGDGPHERQALLTLKQSVPNLLGKSMKFIVRPSVDELRHEIDALHSCLEYVCEHTANLDLQLSKDRMR